MQAYDVTELLADFDSKNPRPDYPYVDFLAFRKTQSPDEMSQDGKTLLKKGEWREYAEVWRADGRIAAWATKDGIETMTSKGWQILRYGNFDRFNTKDEPASEEAQEMKKLCDSHISIRRGVEAQMEASKGIKAKLQEAEKRAANVGK